MTEGRRLHMSPGFVAGAVLSLLFAGAGGTYLLMRGGQARSDAVLHSSPPTTESTPRADVTVRLSSEAVARAGIEVMPVGRSTASDALRVPGIVEPNAYRQVAVTPLVGGRLVGVSVQIGDHVRKGQPVAQIYSPELAEARKTFVAARAMLDAHDRELQRTERLVEIGAASQQELERIHAEHAAQTAEVESARSRLELLGAGMSGSLSSQSQENATTTVPAPIDGVVTERIANTGLNVEPTTKLFTIVDLSTVWIVGDVYERDLQRVREGARANVTATAYASQPFESRVSFIDPQLNAATRTAKVRVEVSNLRGELRLGMYTDLTIESASATSVLVVPREAIQSVGNVQVVYMASPDDATMFIEREVRLGRVMGDEVEVLAGVSAGESVVSKGSFFVRAEAERLGLRNPRPDSSARDATGAPMATSASAGAQTARITITENGFEPDHVSLRAGIPAQLTFIRTTDKTCGTEVVFPSLDIRRALPLDEVVVIEFTPSKPGDVAFACGMNMLRGTVVVE